MRIFMVIIVSAILMSVSAAGAVSFIDRIKVDPEYILDIVYGVEWNICLIFVGMGFHPLPTPNPRSSGAGGAGSVKATSCGPPRCRHRAGKSDMI